MASILKILLVIGLDIRTWSATRPDIIVFKPTDTGGRSGRYPDSDLQASDQNTVTDILVNDTAYFSTIQIGTASPGPRASLRSGGV